jgi:hypothetical protein
MFNERGTMDTFIELLASATKNKIIFAIDKKYGGHPFLTTDLEFIEMYFPLSPSANLWLSLFPPPPLSSLLHSPPNVANKENELKGRILRLTIQEEMVVGHVFYNYK